MTIKNYKIKEFNKYIELIKTEKNFEKIAIEK
jgi:hypothetical protein